MSRQSQEAKNHPSELVNRALTEGPQTITHHGRLAVIVVFTEYSRQSVVNRGKDHSP